MDYVAEIIFMTLRKSYNVLGFTCACAKRWYMYWIWECYIINVMWIKNQHYWLLLVYDCWYNKAIIYLYSCATCCVSMQRSFLKLYSSSSCISHNSFLIAARCTEGAGCEISSQKSASTCLQLQCCNISFDHIFMHNISTLHNYIYIRCIQ